MCFASTPNIVHTSPLKTTNFKISLCVHTWWDPLEETQNSPVPQIEPFLPIGQRRHLINHFFGFCFLFLKHFCLFQNFHYFHAFIFRRQNSRIGSQPVSLYFSLFCLSEQFRFQSCIFTPYLSHTFSLLLFLSFSHNNLHTQAHNCVPHSFRATIESR